MSTAPVAGTPTLRIFGVVMAGLGLALLLPNLFGDPNGIDPHEVRLAIVVIVLTAAAYRLPGLAQARPVILAVSCVVVPFVLWSVSLQVAPWWAHFSGELVIFVAGAVQLVATVAVVFIIRRGGPMSLRLRSFSRSAAVASVAGIVLFIVAGLAFPATLLGRVGIAVPSALAALGNGLVAGDVLQAVSQELQFRGALLAVLERTLVPWQANLAQSVLFGFGHLALEQYEGPVATLIPVTVAIGLLAGWVTQRTGSLWPAITLHIVAEIAVRVAIIPGLYGG